jgi:hypothetical protein
MYSMKLYVAIVENGIDSRIAVNALTDVRRKMVKSIRRLIKLRHPWAKH